MKKTILPGAFTSSRYSVIIDLKTGEHIAVRSIKEWAGDCTCWDVVDEVGRRRIFKANGHHAFGDQFIIVNYVFDLEGQP